MVNNDSAVLVLTTAPSDEVARSIARELLGLGLIACANIVPGVRSVYRWKGEIHDDAEHVMVLKTTNDLAPSVETELIRLHPYETPEFLVVPASAGSEAYLAWIEASCRGAV
jgi:periplasmic divalent cation tolerance protein